VAPHFRAALPSLQQLFDVSVTARSSRWLLRLLLRKLACAEQHEELVGISRATGLALHLLVAFNVLLDASMGGTSGGVRVRDEDEDGGAGGFLREDLMAAAETPRARTRSASKSHGERRPARMLHFRTLDWGMDPLRRLVCSYEYVAGRGGPVIARALTYFGFVGVLTGVRRGLSISLSVGPPREGSSWLARARSRVHQLLVLGGLRPSPASILRDCLLPGKYDPLRILPSLVEVERRLPARRCASCCLVFGDGARTTTMEKAHCSAVVRSASDFIVAVSADAVEEEGRAPSLETASAGSGAVHGRGHKFADERAWENLAGSGARAKGRRGAADGRGRFGGAERPRDDSAVRRRCMAGLWTAAKARRGGPTLRTEDVLAWLEHRDICNEQTHYAVVMDPTSGEFLWVRRFLTPLRCDDKGQRRADQGQGTRAGLWQLAAGRCT